MLAKVVVSLYSIIYDAVKYGGKPVYIYAIMKLIKAIIPVVQVIAIANVIRNLNNEFAIVWVFIVIFCLLYSVLHYKLLSYLELMIQYRFQKSINERMIDTACEIPYKYFENSELYDKTMRISNGSSITLSAFQNLLTMFERVIEVFLLQLVLIRYSPLITIVISAVLLISIFVFAKSSKLSWKTYIETSELEREILYTFETITNRKNIAEMKLFGSFIPLKAKYNERIDSLSKIQLSTMLKNIFYQNISVFSLSITCFFIVFLYAYMLIRGDIYAYIFSGIIAGIIHTINTVSAFSINYSNFLRSVLEYCDLKDFFKQSEKQEPLKPVQKNSNSVIRVKNVTFSYSDDFYVINNISLDINEKECVVIVGENGCGKSTLMKLILGLFQPNFGEVVMFSNKSKKVQGQKPLEIIAIFQDYVKYHLSIREILCAENKENEITDEMINDVLKKVGLLDTVLSLKYGIDTILGKSFFESTDFSEGQWQKLNIARVLMSKANILIFDEPTASLDPIAEAEFYENILKFKGDKTIIIVSHRLGVASIADKIYLMKQGRIISSGVHHELIENCLEYSSMYKNQSQWYQNTSPH